MATSTSETTLLETAQRVLPGGSFGNTAADIIIKEGQGSRVWDEDGKEYIDYLIGSGPMLIGHRHPEVLQAIEAQLARGTTFFANNRQGIELAAMIVDAVPCADKVRFVSTGSEADAFAIRLARAYTKREKILKFEGGYHGFSDYGLMSLAPKKPGNTVRPVADSAGIPDSVADSILVAPFNDIDAVASLIKEHKHTLAAVFMEPVQRLLPPEPGFLAAIRELTQANDVLLVFDEIVTGFRLAYGGAQTYFDVVPDICTLGKVVGGGFPLAAVVGREEIMALFDKEQTKPDQFLPQIGTLSGNPIAAAAGVATLNVLKRPGTYEKLHETGQTLIDTLDELLSRHKIEGQVTGTPPMFDVIFTSGAIRNYRDTLRQDQTLMTELNWLLREGGLLKGDSKYYLSTAIDDTDIQQTQDIWAHALSALKKS